MEKLLIIAEKPSAARNFSKALGGMSGTFEGSPYVIVHLFGHVLAHGTPEETAYPAYKETVGKFSNLSSLPWDYKWFDFGKRGPAGRDIDRVKGILADIKNYLRDGYLPVIASDIDAMGEGDLLVMEVLWYVGYTGKIYREYHVDETPAKFTEALRNKKDVTARNDALTKAVTRQTLDFLTQQIARAATMTVQARGYTLPKSTAGKTQVVPTGRVQSVIMALVGDELEACKNYKPSSIWESRYKLDELILSSPEAPKFKTKEEWEPGGLPAEAKVREVKASPGRTAPPKALSLTALGRLMAAKGISAKRTMELCQKMYEDSVLTYPRTEDDFLTPEQFKEALGIVDNVIRLLGLSPEVFTHREPRKTHVKEGGSHGALRPGVNLPSSVEALDGKYGPGASAVYRTVAERFLMMFLEDTEWVRHEYETIGVTPVFKGSVRIITRKGVTDPDEDTGDVKLSLPDLNKMAKLYPHEVKSTPPAKPTQGWVLGQLIKLSVGTASTQVPTVSRMVGPTKDFPLVEGKKASDPLSLSPIGTVGYQVAKGISLGTPECTRRFEQMASDVVKDKLTQDACYRAFTQTLKEDIEAIYAMSFDFEEIGLEKKAEKAMGTFGGETVKIPAAYRGHTFTKDELDTLFSGKALRFTGQDYNKNSVPMEIRLKWMEYKGKPYVGFEDLAYCYGTFQGEEIKFKRTYMGHTFSDSECEALLAGKAVPFRAVFRDGSAKDVTGSLKKQKTESGTVFWGVKAELPLREGYVRGTFQGKEVTFKGSFSDHTFTEDEAAKLLKGETITVPYTAKSGERKTVSGRLALQSYEGKSYYGFKPDFGNRRK